MQLELRKDKFGVLNDGFYKEIVRAVDFFVKMYKLENRHYHLVVDFDGPLRKNELGSFYMSSDNSGIIRILPSKYKYEMLNTLFHELTHMFQYVSGYLTYTNTNIFWYGVPFPHIDLSAIYKDRKLYDCYQNSPWEKEANATADYVLKKYNEPTLGKIFSRIIEFITQKENLSITIIT